MQQEALTQSTISSATDIASETTTTEQSSALRVAGTCMIAGAVLTTVFNVLFPRAEDPSATTAVLTMMADNEVRRHISFLGVTAGLWLVTAGVVGVCWSLITGSAARWARAGIYGLLVGATIFTVSTGIGMVATNAAVDWAAAGSDTSSPEFAVASTLNAADDGVWAVSLIVYWTALGLLGIGMLMSGVFPKWLAGAILVLGFANAALTGVPLSYRGASQGLIILFAFLAQLTLVWALVTGIWTLRRAR